MRTTQTFVAAFAARLNYKCSCRLRNGIALFPPDANFLRANFSTTTALGCVLLGFVFVKQFIRDTATAAYSHPFKNSVVIPSKRATGNTFTGFNSVVGVNTRGTQLTRQHQDVLSGCGYSCNQGGGH